MPPLRFRTFLNALGDTADGDQRAPNVVFRVLVRLPYVDQYEIVFPFIAAGFEFLDGDLFQNGLLF